nr:hypothetical protein Iba_chr14aCG11960 [Ipomoea batatas]
MTAELWGKAYEDEPRPVAAPIPPPTPGNPLPAPGAPYPFVPPPKPPVDALKPPYPVEPPILKCDLLLQFNCFPSIFLTGSIIDALAASAVLYTNRAYPLDLPVTLSNPSGPSSISPYIEKCCNNLSVGISYGTFPTYIFLNDISTGLLELPPPGPPCIPAAASCDKAVTFTLSSSLIEDYHGLFKLAVGGEKGTKLISGGFPTKAANEKLPLRRVLVGN